MRIALIDNGSLEPAAHMNLRAVAGAISSRTGLPVEAVSWKHSNRIPADRMGGIRARTLAGWIRACVAEGDTDFLFIPFFISAQGAIGSSLRLDIDALRNEVGPLDAAFTESLAESGSLSEILVSRIQDTRTARSLSRPHVVVVDHGGPSPASADVRNAVAAAVRARLGDDAASVTAASMESPEGERFAFNRPLLAAFLAGGGLSGDVIIAPLFLSPGRHAGAGGDLSRIARTAEAANPALRCHFTELVGSHPLCTSRLADSLDSALASPVFP